MKAVRLLFLSAIGISLAISSYGDIPDSSLFNTSFESNVFSKLESQEKFDSIELFLAMDFKSLSIPENLSSFIQKLNGKIQDYPINKKLKTVYKAVHDEFLTKYKEEAYFNDIFINGDYNCVSASALYALVLQGLDISYQIKETPVHVYLIADPGNSTFLIETTLPGEKIIQYDQHLKSQYVEYLHNNKIISDAEFRNSSTDELFDQHFSKDKTISLIKLAGIQYYNRGVFLYNKQSYREAILNFEKAFILYKDDMIRYMLNNSLINQLQLENQQRKYNGIDLARYVNINDSNTVGLQYAWDYFQAVSSELLINKPNVGEYKLFYDGFLKHVRDKDQREIKRIYYFFMGYHHAVNYRYSEALNNLNKSYEINPENVMTRQLITECLTKHVVNDRSLRWTVDSLKRYFRIFPFLKKDNSLMGFAEYSYVNAIQNSLGEENIDMALGYFRGYDLFLKENPDYISQNQLRTAVFQMIASYHMGDNRYDLAEQVLRKGIRTCAENAQLKFMLKNVMSFRDVSYEYPELMDDSRPIKKYLLAIAIAKDNIEESNSYQEYLPGKWKMVLQNSSDTLKLNLQADHTLEIGDGDVKTKGTWRYDDSKGIIHMSGALGNDFRNIVITRPQPGKIDGVHYERKNYEKAADVVLYKVLQR